MDEHGYHYPDVPEILDAMRSEGITLSIANVRTRRGDVGSNSSISQDIRHWKRARGLLELSEEEQEEMAPIPALDVPYPLPAPAPELITRALTTYRLQAQQTVAASHLAAAIAALRGVQAIVPQLVPEMTREHARGESAQGLTALQRTRPRWRDASDALEERLPNVLQLCETFLQQLTLAAPPEEGGTHGRFDPAA